MELGKCKRTIILIHIYITYPCMYIYIYLQYTKETIHGVGIIWLDWTLDRRVTFLLTSLTSHAINGIIELTIPTPINGESNIYYLVVFLFVEHRRENSLKWHVITTQGLYVACPHFLRPTN